MIRGKKRIRKIQIYDKGNHEYERLINSPLTRVIDEKYYNNHASFFVVVTYEDFGYVDEEDEEEKGEGNADNES